MTTNLFDLTGKIALVSGASRGIGEGIARVFAQHGAHVIVSSRKIHDCEAIAEGIRQTNTTSEALACNVGRMEDIYSAFEQIKARHGRLDILVNNAAANPYFGHVLDTDLRAFTKTVDVNIRGYFFMSVEAGKLMRDHDGGIIINTASTGALMPGPAQAIYSITKAAIVNMTKAFAKECAPYNIRANALLPGLTKTKFAGALFTNDQIYKGAINRIPMGRHAEPEEMAGTALYLASEASSYTNGECIVVDGGLVI